MGHMSHQVLKSHVSALHGVELDHSAMNIPNACHGCKLGKSTRASFHAGSSQRSTRIFEIVHSDLAGPNTPKSIQGSSYTATFVDDYSRLALVYYLHTKDQFVRALKTYIAWGETQTGQKLRALHSDCGGEYMSKEVAEILEERGIERHLMMPGSPQQNSKAERFNCTIMDKAMSMLYNAGLSKGFWECAVHTAVHVYNRMPTRTQKWCTPHEVWNPGEVPDVSYFRIFGCKAYVHIPADKHRKVDAKAFEATFVRYEPGAKGYWLWDKRTHSLKLSRDVTFDESAFPSKQSDEQHSAPLPSAPFSVQVPIIASPAPAAPHTAAVPPLAVSALPATTAALPALTAHVSVPAGTVSALPAEPSTLVTSRGASSAQSAVSQEVAQDPPDVFTQGA